MRQTRRPYRVR
ncbi:hypothetical protein YPPY66_4653, partial [Yersinia pestis PY-66]